MSGNPGSFVDDTDYNREHRGERPSDEPKVKKDPQMVVQQRERIRQAAIARAKETQVSEVEAEQVEVSDEKPLSDFTVAELREIAKQEGIEGTRRMGKEELIDALST